jgi:hypothetical protein
VVVKCDICGRMYSHSYLRAHKRLAHKTQSTAPLEPAAHEPETIKAILLLYGQLSDKGQKMVLKGVHALAVRTVERH